MSSSAASESSPTGRREELLDRAVDHVMETGFAELSVRTLASALGVAHNTLTYHFGSRAELLAAIMERLSERALRESGAALLAEPRGDTHGPADHLAQVRSAWEWLSDADQRPMWVTFFEAFAIAVREPDTYATFLTRLSTGWVRPVIAAMVAVGVPPETAEARATMLVATVRGLTLQGLTSGNAERDARADAGFRALAEVVETWTRHPDGSR